MTTTENNTTPVNHVNASTTTATPIATKMAIAPVLTPATPVAAKPVAAKRVAKPRAAPMKATASAPLKTATTTTTKVPVKSPTAKVAVSALAKANAPAKPQAPAKVKVKAVAKPKAEKPAKVKKPKLVRDSFTIPKAEYTVLEDLKQRAGKLASSVKKSEFIRAGIKALAAMSDSAFLAALKAVPAIKTGRPAKAKAE